MPSQHFKRHMESYGGIRYNTAMFSYVNVKLVTLPLEKCLESNVFACRSETDIKVASPVVFRKGTWGLIQVFSTVAFLLSYNIDCIATEKISP